jgi:hypothetical protein
MLEGYLKIEKTKTKNSYGIHPMEFAGSIQNPETNIETPN